MGCNFRSEMSQKVLLMLRNTGILHGINNLKNQIKNENTFNLHNCMLQKQLTLVFNDFNDFNDLETATVIHTRI